MAGIDINQVLADNLRHYMDKRALKQKALAERSGVGQTTISLYLRPESRALGAKGKAPSAKLTEIQMLADALGVEVWELLRHYQPGEREAYQGIETAFKQLRSLAVPTIEPEVENRKAA